MTLRNVDDAGRQTLLDQIGRMNLLAISGGRVVPIDAGVLLPVSSGYSVRVELTAFDTYRVSRVFLRCGKEIPKGVRDEVYADELAQAAYFAGMFESYDEYEWADAR